MSGPWDAVLAAMKAASYAATLAAAGTVLFLYRCQALLPASRVADVRRLLRRLLIASAVASCAKISTTAASMSGDAAGMLDVGLNRMILQAGEGAALLARAIGWILMISVAIAPLQRPPPAALVGAALAATSFAWVGHVHAAAAAPLATGVLALHLLGVAFWLGGLMPLLLMTRGADLACVAATAGRFGSAALVVVGVLLAAGAGLLTLLLPGLRDLWTSDYGRLVSVKVAVVACMLAMAARNHYRWTPALKAGDARALPALRRSILCEIALAVAILSVTAAMTTVTGPASE
jgi:putative copper resistance protein D